MPAPAMITRTPRSAAVDAYSATARGSRCAESTRSSQEIPRLSSSTPATSIASRSDSEPMRIATSGPDSSNSSRIGSGSGLSSGGGMDCSERDVATVLDAGELDLVDRPVGSLARLADRDADARDIEDAPARADERAAPERRARVEDESAGGFGVRDASERHAAFGPIGVAVRSEHDGHGCLWPGRQLDPGERALRRRGERFEEVALEPWQDRLRLGVAEAAVELEHPRPVFREHQPRVEQPLEGRAVRGELAEHRAVNRLDELGGLFRREGGHRRVAPHAARVRTRVAVEEPLEILGRGERQRPVPRKSPPPTSASRRPRARLARGPPPPCVPQPNAPSPAASPSALTTHG